MNRLVACLCVLLLSVSVTVSRGEDPKPQREDAAIETLVAESMDAGRKMDWKRYAELVHPESLQEYKNMWLPVLQVAIREGPEKQADLLSAFDKATDLKTLISLKPKEFFLSSMKGMESQLRGLNAGPLEVDEKIIGTVREGGNRAYVVVRTRRKIAGTEMNRVEVVELKRSGAEWQLILPDSVRVLAETFRRTGQDTQKSGPVRDRADPDKER
jgi:hypothetical protein